MRIVSLDSLLGNGIPTLVARFAPIFARRCNGADLRHRAPCRDLGIRMHIKRPCIRLETDDQRPYFSLFGIFGALFNEVADRNGLRGAEYSPILTDRPCVGSGTYVGA